MLSPLNVHCSDTSSEMFALLNERTPMDRRRLEEGFLLFAAADVISKYSLSIETIPYDRNELAELVTNYFHDAFIKKWVGK